MLAANSCLLTDVVEQLHEDTKKVNSVERLTHHLNKGVPNKALLSYLQAVFKWVPDDPVIHIDDNDIVKPHGYKFESLDIVRDGSKSTNSKNVLEKGYHVTEACVITEGNHPVSTFQKFILLKKKTSPLLIPLHLKQWNVENQCLVKQPLSWIGAMMITRCSLNSMN